MEGRDQKGKRESGLSGGRNRFLGGRRKGKPSKRGKRGTSSIEVQGMPW